MRRERFLSYIPLSRAAAQPAGVSRTPGSQGCLARSTGKTTGFLPLPLN